MKTILLRESTDGAEAYRWGEDATVRRVILSGAVRTTTTSVVEVAVRRGPAKTIDLAHGDQDIIAAIMLVNSSAFNLDMPVYETVREGDSWHINCNLLSGTSAEQYATALVLYEAGIAR